MNVAAALRDVAKAERVGEHGLAAARGADDQRDPAGVDGVERVCALDRSAGVGGPDDHPAGRPAPARGQRDAMGDVPLRVAAGRAQLVDAERQRRGEPGQAQPPAADHAGVGERVELARGLLDGALELLEPAVRVADRAVDPDSVDARADLGGELGVDGGGLLERLVLVGADDAGRGAPCRAPRREAASTGGAAAPARARGRRRRCAPRASPAAGSTAGARATTGRCAPAGTRGAGSPRASRRRGAASPGPRRRRSRTSAPSQAASISRWRASRACSVVVAVGDLAGGGERDRGRTRHRSRGAAAPTAARASACRPADRSRSRRRAARPRSATVMRALSIAASRCADHSVRPARAGRERSQLLARGLEPRQVGDRDPPARGDGGLLGAGGGEHGLGRRLEQPLASVGELVDGRRRGRRPRPPGRARGRRRAPRSSGPGRSARRRRSPGGRGSPGTRSRRPARSSRAWPGRP